MMNRYSSAVVVPPLAVAVHMIGVPTEPGKVAFTVNGFRRAGVLKTSRKSVPRQRSYCALEPARRAHTWSA